MTRRILVSLGIVVLAAVLAFPLRGAVYEVVVVPIAYFFWLLALLYHAVHQTVWWILILFIVLVPLFRSLLPKPKARAKTSILPPPSVGRVEGLVVWMKKAERGIYFKWLIANRLGKIAHQILSLRETGRQRSIFEPLAGPDWTPDPAVQSYLQAGLHRSFADYPQNKNPFARPKATPLDHGMAESIEYLESQLKN